MHGESDGQIDRHRYRYSLTLDYYEIPFHTLYFVTLWIIFYDCITFVNDVRAVHSITFSIYRVTITLDIQTYNYIYLVQSHESTCFLADLVVEVEIRRKHAVEVTTDETSLDPPRTFI